MPTIKFGLPAIALLALSCHSTPGNKNSENKSAADIVNKSYNEAANTEERTPFNLSDYNADNPDIKNIERPAKSSIVNSTLDTTLLFGAWTDDREGPHASFNISAKSFYIVDYDGDGAMPYVLNGNKLKIFYNDFIYEGEIMYLDNSTLKLKDDKYGDTGVFTRWIY